MQEIPPPSDNDWGQYKSDLDQMCSYATFFGKSRTEASELFRRAPIERIDELRFMPARVFNYYILSLHDYLLSPDALGHTDVPDAASGYINLLEEKLVSGAEGLRDIMPELKKSLDFVATNQALFGADPEIYGDFSSIRNRIVDSL